MLNKTSSKHLCKFDILADSNDTIGDIKTKINNHGIIFFEGKFANDISGLHLFKVTKPTNELTNLLIIGQIDGCKRFNLKVDSSPLKMVERSVASIKKLFR